MKICLLKKNGFANETIIGNFFKNSENRKNFESILNNNNLSETSKSNQFEALGLEKVAIPGLENLEKGIIKNLGSISGDSNVSPALQNALQSLIDKINNQIKEDKNKINELRK